MTFTQPSKEELTTAIADYRKALTSDYEFGKDTNHLIVDSGFARECLAKVSLARLMGAINDELTVAFLLTFGIMVGLQIAATRDTKTLESMLEKE